jgi:hypothetical protein
MGSATGAGGRRLSYRDGTVRVTNRITSKETVMSRYLVERTFPEGLSIPQTDAGARLTRQVIAHNAMDGVTWVHSYVNPEKTKTFCIYDGPSPEAIRTVAERNKLPVDRITEVSVLDPYFYRA